MTQGVYGIFSADCCLYVGQSTQIENRWSAHLRLLRSSRHHNRGLQEWFASHPDGEMSFRVLEEVSSGESLAESEAFWFESLKPRFWGRKPGSNWRWSEVAPHVLEALSESRSEDALRRLEDLDARCGAEVEADYASGVPLMSIAERRSISYPAVRRVLRYRGVRIRSAQELRKLSLDEDMRAEAESALSEGSPVSMLAESWGVSETTARRALDEAGLKPRRDMSAVLALKSYGPELESLVKELRGEGLSMRAVADRLGVGRSTLIRELKRITSGTPTWAAVAQDALPVQ